MNVYKYCHVGRILFLAILKKPKKQTLTAADIISKTITRSFQNYMM